MRAYAHAIAELEARQRRRGAEAHDVADDFVADAHGVVCWAPTRAEGVDVGTADAAVGDFYVYVGGCEGFGGEGLVD